MKKIEFFKVEGDKINRFRKHCPKCGPGIFLGEHKDRFSCGNCGYTEFKSGGKKEPKPQPVAPVEEKPIETPKVEENPEESAEQPPVGDQPSKQESSVEETPAEEPPKEPETTSEEPNQEQPPTEEPIGKPEESAAEEKSEGFEKKEKTEDTKESKD